MSVFCESLEVDGALGGVAVRMRVGDDRISLATPLPPLYSLSDARIRVFLIAQQILARPSVNEVVPLEWRYGACAWLSHYSSAVHYYPERWTCLSFAGSAVLENIIFKSSGLIRATSSFLEDDNCLAYLRLCPPDFSSHACTGVASTNSLREARGNVSIFT